MRKEPVRTQAPRPFSLSPDPGLFYPSSCHEAALTCLENGRRDGRCLQTLTGAPGLGKTILLHVLADRLAGSALPVFVSLDSVETETELFRAVCARLCLSFTGRSVAEMERDIRRFARRSGGKSVVLLLDEADPLREAVWDPVLRLCGTQRKRRDRIPSILAGPPELVRCATAASEGVPVSLGACSLRPLTSQETIQYILHRLFAAGLRAEERFSPGALQRIVHGSGGVPRRINAICAAVLDICRGTGTWPAEASTVQEALGDLRVDEESSLRNKPEPMEEIERILEDARFDGAGKTLPLPPARTRQNRTSPERPTAGRWGGRVGGRSGPSREGAPRPEGNGKDPVSFPRDAGRFLAWFLLVVALLGGGTLLQVFHHDRQTREWKRKVDGERLGAVDPKDGAPVAPAFSGRDGGGAAADPLTRYLKDRQGSIRDELGGILDSPLEPIGTTRTFHDQDVAGIALDCCGGLDRNLLEAFMRSNPHVNDWNALGRTVELAMPFAAGPGAAAPTPGVDIHSVFVASYESRSAAFLAAEGLNRAGFQNLFVITTAGGPARRRHDLFAGVFVTERAAAEAGRWMKRSGFPEARPARVRTGSLAAILHPYRPLEPHPSSPGTTP